MPTLCPSTTTPFSKTNIHCLNQYTSYRQRQTELIMGFPSVMPTFKTNEGTQAEMGVVQRVNRAYMDSHLNFWSYYWVLHSAVKY